MIILTLHGFCIFDLAFGLVAICWTYQRAAGITPYVESMEVKARCEYVEPIKAEIRVFAQAGGACKRKNLVTRV